MSSKSVESLLESACRAVTAATGFPVCVYDFSYFCCLNAALALPVELREHRSAYCMLVKRNQQCQYRCVAEETARAKEAYRRGEPLVHTCHAGITEIVVPLHAGEALLGALYYGQMFVDNCQSRRAARALCKRYGYDESEMFDALAAQEARTAGLMEGLALVNLLAALIEREEQLRLLRGEPSSPTRGHTVSQRPTDMVSIPNPYLARLHQHGGTLARIAEALKRCYMHDVDAARLAAQVGVGPRTLNGVLLRTTGRHLRDTVRRARVSAASYLLKCSSLSVGEIAGAVGYENPFAFSRAFRAVTGLSPSKYRKRQVYTNLSGE